MMEINCDTWYWYLSGKETETLTEESGKWMLFFPAAELKKARNVCKKAITEKVCVLSKCRDMRAVHEDEGVMCFYVNADDAEGHKRIIRFMLDNNLVPRTRTGRLYDMSFKLDKQTEQGEYGDKFVAVLKLHDFIDLNTGNFL